MTFKYKNLNKHNWKQIADTSFVLCHHLQCWKMVKIHNKNIIIIFKRVEFCLYFAHNIFFSGNAILTLEAKDAIKVITVRSTAFPPEPLQGGSAAVDKAPEGDYKSDLVQFVSQELAKSDRPELTSAKNIVAGGKKNNKKFINEF